MHGAHWCTPDSLRCAWVKMMLCTANHDFRKFLLKMFKNKPFFKKLALSIYPLLTFAMSILFPPRECSPKLEGNTPVKSTVWRISQVTVKLVLSGAKSDFVGCIILLKPNQITFSPFNSVVTKIFELAGQILQMW